MRRGLLLVLLGLVAGAATDAETWGGGGQPASKKSWPFKPWSHAKAYTFNFVEYQPELRLQLKVLDDGKWNTLMRSEQPVTEAQAKAVVTLVNSTKGSFESSKCPFPRHAFVFYDEANKPVGTVDVCFSCEDLFVWPDFPISAEAKYENAKIVKAFPKALLEYKRLFQELGQPVDWKSAPAFSVLPTPTP